MVRTRFAPSPTGNLHVGGLRTALYNYAFAKHHAGDFTLRIEDTDMQRNSVSSAQGIVDGMAWACMPFDGNIVYQSQRLSRYHQVIDQLLEAGFLYRCLDVNPKEANDIYRSPYRDINLSNTTQGIIRCKIPLHQDVSFDDMVKGRLQTNTNQIEDWVVCRSDGTPTYNFAVVVDDMDMNITHVIRGDDHTTNTFKQIVLYQMLNATIPTFAHIPMILDSTGKKLSKRTLMQVAGKDPFPVDVDTAKAQWIHPSALMNYLARLGWSHQQWEVFSLLDMVSVFDGSSLQKSPARVDSKKLHWLNMQYIKNTPKEDIKTWLFSNSYVDKTSSFDRCLDQIWSDLMMRSDKTTSFKQDIVFFSSLMSNQLPSGIKKGYPSSMTDALVWFRARCANHDPLQWHAPLLQSLLTETAVGYQISIKDLATCLREGLTLQNPTPPLGLVFAGVGQSTTLAWLDAFLDSPEGPFGFFTSQGADFSISPALE